MLDGEIVALGPDGRPDFYRLMFRRDWPVFYAFDVPEIDRTDLRGRPLTERKRRLEAIMPRVQCRLQPVLSIRERGRDLFDLACREDLEGVVAKWGQRNTRKDVLGLPLQTNNIGEWECARIIKGANVDVSRFTACGTRAQRCC